MKNKLHHMEDILSHNISGYHRYLLTDPIHLCYVSRNLCDLVGYAEEELLSEQEDRYMQLVHPADRNAYLAFLHQLQEKEQTLTAEYRLLTKEGRILVVSDTVVSVRLEDGTLAGDSVLTDITRLKKETGELQFLNETIPCGFLKYTCEKQPKVTYMNREMLEFLHFPEEQALEELELYKENIFLMIPMEERRKFSLYLDRVYSAGAPVAGDITILRYDGTRAHLFGWVTKCINEHGEEEFQSVCMDMTERHLAKKADATKRYLKALTDVYDKIFEYDLSANTVKCLYSNNSPAFRWLEDIPMQMEEATEKWIAGTVVPEDCNKLRTFFRDFRQKRLYQPDAKPPQITYRARSSEGEIRRYRGIFLKMEEQISFYCCRCVSETKEAELLRTENVSLKENMQELLLRFTDGIAAFEITDSTVTPLYASDNVCEFFGFTKEEWLPLMKKSTPIREFVARSNASYANISALLRNGESEFAYFDLDTQTERRIKAICSPKSPSGSATRYVMLYNVAENEAEKPKEEPGQQMLPKPAVFIRTFGYFDVFVDGKPIAFRNKKSKELFALLVDRRGGYITSEEAIGFLWEEEPVSPVTLSRYRKVALRLKNMLEEYGISEVVESIDGKRRIVTEKVQCDLYDYLTGKEEFAQLFKGSYLTNYSWGESMLSELTGNSLF